MLLKLYITILCILFCLNISAQNTLKVLHRYFEDQTFSRISKDETGIWAISGDSLSIYRLDFKLNILNKYSVFNSATSKKFTGILAKGSDKVMVATAGDYLLYYNNGVVTKFGENAGIKNRNLNSLFGDLTYTVIGTDSLAYESNNNLNFNELYFSCSSSKRAKILNTSTEFYSTLIGDFSPSEDSYFLQRANYNSKTCVTFYINNDEIPLSAEFDTYTTACYLATNKRLLYHPDGINNAYPVLESPVNSLVTYSDQRGFKSLLIASKSGLYVIDSLSAHKILGDIEVYDIINDNDRYWWLATNKGIILLSGFIYTNLSGEYKTCLKNPITIEIKNSRLEDSINWYRNKIIINSAHNKSCIVDQGGTYQAIVYNKVLGTSDTTKTIIINTSYFNYSFSPSSDSVYLCKGNTYNLNIWETDLNSIVWLKNGVKFSNQNTSISIKDEGIYSVIMKNCNDEILESSKIVVKTVEKPYINFNYNNDTSICAFEKLNLITTTNGNSNYYENESQIQTSTHILDQESTFTFNSTYLNLSYCISTKSIKLSLKSLPFALVEKNGDELIASSILKNSAGQVKLSFKLKDYQWYFNDVAIDGAKDSIIKTMNAGVYKVRVTDFNNCSNFSNSFLNNPLDINTIKSENSIVYPNPTDGIFSVYANFDNGINGIKIYNNEGIMVKSYINISATPFICDISNQNNGMYIVQLLGNKPVFIKIILQK